MREGYKKKEKPNYPATEFLLKREEKLAQSLSAG